jgi:hypothetical protein
MMLINLYVKSRLDPLSRVNKSHKGFYKVLGTTPRSLPSAAVFHASVKKRYEAGDYNPKPLRKWLNDNEGYWGAIET